MFRGFVLSLFLLGLVGCAHPSPRNQPPLPPVAELNEHAVTASLVVGPAFLANEPRIEITRQGRAPVAYAGFEELTFTQFFLYQDDRQLNYNTRNHDRFERQAIIQKTGATYR